jgi:hypothetical protein
MLMAMLVAGAGAQADDSEELRRYVRSAVQLFQTLDYERALQQLRHARPLVRTSDEDVVVTLLEGVIYAHLGKRAQSDAAFRAALTLDSKAKLPVEVSPTLNEHFEALRAVIRKQQPGDILPPQPAAAPAATAPQPTAKPAPDVPAAAAPAPSVVAVAPPNLPVVDNAPANPEVTAESGSLRSGAWIPALAGLVVAAAGGACVAQSYNVYGQLTGPRSAGPIDQATASSLASEGKTYQGVGFAAITVGAAALVGAGVMFVAGGGSGPHVTAGVAPSGGSVAVSWTFR